MKGKFFGIGVGVGDPDLISYKAVKTLKQIDYIVLPEAVKGEGSVAFEIAKKFLNEKVQKIFLEFPMIKELEKKIEIRKNNAKIISEYLEKGNNVAFLTIGDPMTYSTYSYVLEYLKTYEVETIAGITSFSSIASRLNIPLVLGNEDLKIISVSKDTNFQKEFENNDNIVFMKISRNLDKIKSEIKRLNYEKNIVLVSNCGKENEEIYYDLEKVEEVPYFSTLIFKKGGFYE